MVIGDDTCNYNSWKLWKDFFSQHKILKLAKVSVIETYLSTCKDLIPYEGEMYQVIVATCFLVGIPVKI
jgi:hypothetical protein